VFFDVCGFKPAAFVAELGTTAGEALLAPHRSYLRAMRPLLDQSLVKGMAHITGGGVTENLPRVLPGGCAAEVDLRSWQVPGIFRFVQEHGAIAADEMFRAFNMGIGLIVVCAAENRQLVTRMLEEAGESPIALGRVVRGERTVQYL
jgi:phosphoribosylformylglycinamidine cyclo-ligase